MRKNFKPKKTVALVTTNRADWSYVWPLAKAILKSNKLKLRLIATGSHFLKAYGYTINDILSSGLRPDANIAVRISSDQAADIGYSLGQYVSLFSKEFKKHKPDILVLFGDRLEVLAVALSATAFNIAIAHIGGGEITEGAVDDMARHALTKIARLHFASSCASVKKILQMGEEKWRVHNTGSLANDSIRRTKLLTIKEIKKAVPFASSGGYLLVTQHPETIDSINTDKHIRSLLSALISCNMPVVFTYPNTDVSNKVIIERVRNFTRKNKDRALIKNAGRRFYYSLIRHAAAVVGNSSSGIYDTPYFKVPAVNIGRRQKGRIKAKNVIDAGYKPKDIERAIKKAVSRSFRASLDNGIKDFFGKGNAAQKITMVLEKTQIDGKLYNKKFIRQ